MAKANRRPSDALAELRKRVQVEGLDAAYEALVQICRDPKASSQARATASTTLFRAGGLLERVDDIEDLEPHEMSAAQLQASIAKGVQLMEELSAGELDQPEDAPSVEPEPGDAPGVEPEPAEIKPTIFD